MSVLATVPVQATFALQTYLASRRRARLSCGSAEFRCAWQHLIELGVDEVPGVKSAIKRRDAELIAANYLRELIHVNCAPAKRNRMCTLGRFADF